MEEAFITLTVSLCNRCILHVPVSSDMFVVHTDASCRGIGEVLNVCRDGDVLPVAFFSQQIRGAEHRYSATELEALAVVLTVNNFPALFVWQTL